MEDLCSTIVLQDKAEADEEIEAHDVLTVVCDVEWERVQGQGSIAHREVEYTDNVNFTPAIAAEAAAADVGRAGCRF